MMENIVEKGRNAGFAKGSFSGSLKVGKGLHVTLILQN